MKILKLCRIGDPILRQKAKRLSKNEVLSQKVQTLIADIRYTCQKKPYGVGLSAPQVGQPLAISVLAVKPTLNRPNLKSYEKVLINAEIIKTFGKPIKMWEGCCSIGKGSPTGGDFLYGLVPRYQKVQVRYLDENAIEREETITGFAAHVVQHEVDHINGVLFTDRADRRSFMMGDEYRKRVVKQEEEK